MADDAFLYFPGSEIKGETQDEDMSKKDAFEIVSFSFGAENTIDIGSISSGGGAGKATFKEFNVTKKTDLGSCPLFLTLCQGGHLKEAIIEIRRSGGAAGASGATFLKFVFAFVMVQDMSWSGSGGEPCEEEIIFQYGAMSVEYFKQSPDGSMTTAAKTEWSRVVNKMGMSVPGL